MLQGSTALYKLPGFDTGFLLGKGNMLSLVCVYECVTSTLGCRENMTTCFFTSTVEDSY